MLIWSLGITLRIVTKINILPASPPVVVVYLVLAALKRILARMLMLLGIGVLIILPTIIFVTARTNAPKPKLVDCYLIKILS